MPASPDKGERGRLCGCLCRSRGLQAAELLCAGPVGKGSAPGLVPGDFSLLCPMLSLAGLCLFCEMALALIFGQLFLLHKMNFFA